MLARGLLFTAAAALIGFAAAQNSTSSSTFNAGSVDLTTKNQWCRAETNNCPTLCGGPMQVKQNQCTGSSLTYSCTCANNSPPANIDQYQGTLPNYICEATFEQCRQQNPGSDQCKTCGTLMPSDVMAIPVSTAMPSASASASGSAAPAASPTGAEKSGRAGRLEVEVREVVMAVAMGAVALAAL
ncbi:hypothetical protein MMC21_005235 [Puttea exsequens]|nr:hypothetical protein [Puttea exsequens]